MEKKDMKNLSNKIKVAGIAITLAASTGAGYYAVPSVHLYDQEFTLNQYDQIKPIFADLMKHRGKETLSFAQAEIWKDIAAREMKKCGGWNLVGVTDRNIIDKMNEKIINNTC